MSKFNSRVSAFMIADDQETYSAQAKDALVYTDESTVAQNATTGDMNLLPDPPEADDAYYWGSAAPFHGIWLLTSQAMTGTVTVVWEYWDGDSWETLTVSDESVGLTGAAGYKLISWAAPSDWATTAVNSVTKYWVRVRCSAYTTDGYAQPLGTQSWLIRDLSEFITEVSGLPGERETLDTTTVGDAGREHDPSLENGIIRLAGFWDDTATRGPDTVLGYLLTHTSNVYFSYGPSGKTTTKIAYEGYCWVRRYEITTRVGEMVGWTAELEVNGQVTKTTYT